MSVEVLDAKASGSRKLEGVSKIPKSKLLMSVLNSSEDDCDTTAGVDNFVTQSSQKLSLQEWESEALSGRLRKTIGNHVVICDYCCSQLSSNSNGGLQISSGVNVTNHENLENRCRPTEGRMIMEREEVIEEIKDNNTMQSSAPLAIGTPGSCCPNPSLSPFPNVPSGSKRPNVSLTDHDYAKKINCGASSSCKIGKAKLSRIKSAFGIGRRTAQSRLLHLLRVRQAEALQKSLVNEQIKEMRLELIKKKLYPQDMKTEEFERLVCGMIQDYLKTIQFNKRISDSK